MHAYGHLWVPGHCLGADGGGWVPREQGGLAGVWAVGGTAKLQHHQELWHYKFEHLQL